MEHLPMKLARIIVKNIKLAKGIILAAPVEIILQNKNITVAKNYKNGQYKFKIIVIHFNLGSKISEIIIKFNGSSAPAPNPIRMVEVYCSTMLNGSKANA